MIKKTKTMQVGIIKKLKLQYKSNKTVWDNSCCIVFQNKTKKIKVIRYKGKVKLF